MFRKIFLTVTIALSSSVVFAECKEGEKCYTIPPARTASSCGQQSKCDLGGLTWSQVAVKDFDRFLQEKCEGVQLDRTHIRIVRSKLLEAKFGQPEWSQAVMEMNKVKAKCMGGFVPK